MLHTSLLDTTPRLFTHPLLERDKFVIEQEIPLLIKHYHECLLDSPKPLAFVKNTLGLSLSQVKTHEIGFADRSLSLQLPRPKAIDGKKLRGSLKRLSILNATGHESMRGCITLPIIEDNQPVALFGLRYDRPRRGASPTKHSYFGVNPIFTLQGLGAVAIRCNHPLDVIALDKYGYQNGYAELEDEMSELSCDMLHQLGVSIIVYFSDPMGASFNVRKAKTLAARYNITLCELSLPFTVMNIGKWDALQWKVFEARLTRALSSIGARNERYQA
jgi:hypothetical protein